MKLLLKIALILFASVVVAFLYLVNAYIFTGRDPLPDDFGGRWILLMTEAILSTFLATFILGVLLPGKKDH